MKSARVIQGKDETSIFFGKGDDTKFDGIYVVAASK